MSELSAFITSASRDMTPASLYPSALTRMPSQQSAAPYTAPHTAPAFSHGMPPALYPAKNAEASLNISSANSRVSPKLNAPALVSIFSRRSEVSRLRRSGMSLRSILRAQPSAFRHPTQLSRPQFRQQPAISHMPLHLPPGPRLQPGQLSAPR